MNDLNFENHLD